MDTRTALIVVAEDETLIRMLIVEVLMDEGFKVIEAAHAGEAIRHLEARAENVRVLFTDVHMPGDMDGIELAHHAKVHWPWIGLIVTSGVATPPPPELPPGSRFVAKPYDPLHVLDHVRELVSA